MAAQTRLVATALTEVLVLARRTHELLYRLKEALSRALGRAGVGGVLLVVLLLVLVGTELPPARAQLLLRVVGAVRKALACRLFFSETPSEVLSCFSSRNRNNSKQITLVDF